MNSTTVDNLEKYRSKWGGLLTDAHLARLRTMGSADEAEWLQANENVEAVERILEHQHLLISQGTLAGRRYAKAWGTAVADGKRR